MDHPVHVRLRKQLGARGWRFDTAFINLVVTPILYRADHADLPKLRLEHGGGSRAATAA